MPLFQHLLKPLGFSRLIQFDNLHCEGTAAMAPGLVETAPSHLPASQEAKLSSFPDGLKTSGQHPPVYSQVQPYLEFPKVHAGPTVWTADDYRENPELWTHQFSLDEIFEISAAADNFIERGTPLTGISKVSSMGYRPVYQVRIRKGFSNVLDRRIFLFPTSVSAWKCYEKISLTAKGFFSSEAFQYANGISKNARRRTWALVPT